MPQNANGRTERQTYHVLSRRFYQWGVRKGLARAPEGPARLQHLLTSVEARYAFAFQREARAFNLCLRELAACHYVDDEEMVGVVADCLCAFANAHFTRAELEARYDEPEARVAGGIELNCILECELSSRDPRILKLHLRPTSRMTSETLREAFRVLAAKVEQDGPLQQVETIWLTSWIVVEHPGLIRRLGFTCLRGKVSGVGHGRMSRETLLEKYGTPSACPSSVHQRA